MQIYIEGQHIDIQPALHDWITERFEELNTPHNDILHARMVLDKATHHIQEPMRYASSCLSLARR